MHPPTEDTCPIMQHVSHVSRTLWRQIWVWPKLSWLARSRVASCYRSIILADGVQLIAEALRRVAVPVATATYVNIK
ncbi:hypothetical protein VNO78_19000 [Psophocarpus tetragonolobus]|uniref:Uncharacterized protein n=1 Tax=Psophocarpus tetragonolobus TaxID=3891 RepID=A0AAN9SB12_PSOTE